MNKFLKSLVFPKVFSIVGEEDGGGTPVPGPDDGEDVSDDALDSEGWVAKRGVDNVRAELKRQRGELKTAKEELAKLKTAPTPKEEPKPEPTNQNGYQPPNGTDRKYPPSIQKYYTKAIGLGLSEEFVRAQCDMQFEATGEAMGYGKNLFDGLSEVQQDHAERKLEKIVKGLQEDKKTKAVSVRYAKEIEEEFKKIPTKDWAKQKDDVFDRIAGRHIADFTSNEYGGEPTPGGRTVSEGSNSGSGRSVSGVTEDELEEAAKIHGFDLDKKEGRDAAAVFVKNKKERDSARESFNNQK